MARIADENSHLADIFYLDNATNDRLLAENQLLPRIGAHELVFGLLFSSIVNAGFMHADPLAGRFNGPDRGGMVCGVRHSCGTGRGCIPQNNATCRGGLAIP